MALHPPKLELRLPKQQAEELFTCAKGLVSADRYDAALRALNKALQQAPTAQLYDYRGVILSLTLQIEAALESFNSALEISLQDSERAKIYFHRGLLYGHEQLYDFALQDFSQACCLNRFDPAYREAHDHLLSFCEARDASPDLAAQSEEEIGWLRSNLCL